MTAVGQIVYKETVSPQNYTPEKAFDIGHIVIHIKLADGAASPRWSLDGNLLYYARIGFLFLPSYLWSDRQVIPGGR